MPRISATTPMLLMIASNRTPNTLITVVVISVTRPMKDWTSSPGTGDGSASLIWSGKMVERTRGTVTATAVTVITRPRSRSSR